MSEENIFMFVPNIIGYARIILALVSFWYMPNDYVTASLCYLLSGFLDAFDGHAARLLNQGTKFGAMLDQLTDRCATMCLLVVLSVFYPTYMFVFQVSMVIDIASHWLHIHTTISKGSTSHKAIDLEGNAVLRIYYTSKPVLFCMCAGNELFYCMLYICHFTPGPTFLGLGLWQAICVLTAPVAFVKSGISVIHLYAASLNLAAIDLSDRAVKSE